MVAGFVLRAGTASSSMVASSEWAEIPNALQILQGFGLVHGLMMLGAWEYFHAVSYMMKLLGGTGELYLCAIHAE